MNKDKIFYFSKNGWLVWIVGYTQCDSCHVSIRIKALLELSIIFAEFAKCDLDRVCTYFITESNRYKYMDIFYCTTDYIPEEAMVIDHEEFINWVR